MASASGSPPASAGEIPLDACGAEAAINMPRSNAAVLTSMRTPSELESCVASEWEGELEPLCSEWDGERPADLDSNVTENIAKPTKIAPGPPKGHRLCIRLPRLEVPPKT